MQTFAVWFLTSSYQYMLAN